MSNLFISHSSRDNAAAKELQAKLEEQGHRSVFLDLDPETGIQAGVSWERTLYTKLRACRAVVALCSDSYLASQWCFAEIALARMEGKELFVLQIDPWSDKTQMPSILTEEQFIDLRTNKDDGYQRLWNGFKVKGIVAEEHREWGPEDPPYPGLRAFDETDAPIFFGREPDVREGLELLNRIQRQGHPRLMMVLGSSGSGKSSLVRAGIVPRLRRDGNRWLVVGPFRPGPQPARELAVALSLAFDRAGEARPWEAIHRRLTATPLAAGAGKPAGQTDPARQRLLQALHSMAGELTDADAGVASSVKRLEEFLASVPAPAQPSSEPSPAGTGGPLVQLAEELRLLRGATGANVLLVIDQFEELLGHEQEGADHPANIFLRQLRDSLDAANSPVLALGTMRSDYLGVLQQSVPLQGLGFKDLSVGPMSPEGMKEIIERPALLGQIQLGNGLTDCMLRETGSSDALPLLAFTLRVMWDRYHDGRVLEMKHYEAIGKLEGAVAQVADDTLETALELGEEDRLRDAFLSLARPAAEGSGWSREALRWDDVDEAVQPMLQCFVDQRLLVKRGDGTVEVAHEALFRSWKKLRGWLDENAEGLHLLRDVRTDAAKWDAADSAEKKEYLWRGGRLARALELRDGGVLSLEDLDQAFLDTSAQAEEGRRQRKRRVAWLITAASVAVAIFALLGGAYTNKLKNDAVEQAHLANAGRLASQTLNKLNSRHDLALLLSVEATRATALPTAEAESSLLTALHHNPRLERILHGPQGQVWTVAYSPRNGKLLATGHNDGTIQIWDVARAESMFGPLREHDGAVRSVAFNPVGSRLASGGVDTTVRLWDTESGTQLGKSMEEHDEMVRVVAFAGPDGSVLASGDEGGTVRLWKVGPVEPLGEPLGVPLEGLLDSVRSLSFSSTGSMLFASGVGGIARWTLDTDPPRGELFDRKFSNCLALSNRWLASGYSDGSIRLWDISTGEPRCSPPGTWHSGEVWSMAFDTDGDILASGGSDNTIRLWSVDKCMPLESPILEGHSANVFSVAFSPASRSGSWLASASGDKSIRVWNLKTTQPLGRALSGNKQVVLTSLAFRPPDGRLLAVGGFRHGDDDESTYGEITLWETDDHRPSDRQLEGPFERIDSVAFSPDGKLLVTGGAETVGLWDVATRRQLPSPTGQEDEVNGIAFSRDVSRDPKLASAGADGVIRVWDLAIDSPQPKLLEAHSASVTNVTFSPDSSVLASGSDDKTVRLWDVNNSRPLEPPMKNLETPSALSFGATGKTLASTSGNKILLWDVASRKELKPPLKEHDREVNALAFSPNSTDARRLASGGKDNTIRLWNAETRRSLEPPLRGHDEEVISVAFSPDGKRLASGDFDNQVMLWDVDIGSWRARACRTANRNLSQAEWVEFMPSRKYVCTCPNLLPGSGTELAACP